MSERGNNVREVERTEALLQRQLARWMERTEGLRKRPAEKSEAAKKRMEELRAIHRRLGEERGEKGREVERRRVRVEQVEKKVMFWSYSYLTQNFPRGFSFFLPGNLAGFLARRRKESG